MKNRVTEGQNCLVGRNYSYFLAKIFMRSEISKSRDFSAEHKEGPLPTHECALFPCKLGQENILLPPTCDHEKKFRIPLYSCNSGHELPRYSTDLG